MLKVRTYAVDFERLFQLSALVLMCFSFLTAMSKFFQIFAEAAHITLQ
jgi:hypothetical protein